MFVKYFKQSKFLTRHLSLMPEACTTDRQPWCTQSTDSRISAVGGWSCNKLLTLDDTYKAHASVNKIVARRVPLRSVRAMTTLTRARPPLTGRARGGGL